MHQDRYLAEALAIVAAVLPALAIEPRESSFDRTLPVTGPVELDAATHAGSIQVRAGAAGSVVVHGVIRVNRASTHATVAPVSGEVRAHNRSGAIELNAIQAALRAHTGSGGVGVRLPSQAGFDLHAHAGSGRIDCDQPLTVRGSLGGRNLAAKRGNGGPLVELSTGSGGIRIDSPRAAQGTNVRFTIRSSPAATRTHSRRLRRAAS